LYRQGPGVIHFYIWVFCIFGCSWLSHWRYYGGMSSFSLFSLLNIRIAFYLVALTYFSPTFCTEAFLASWIPHCNYLVIPWLRLSILINHTTSCGESHKPHLPLLPSSKLSGLQHSPFHVANLSAYLCLRLLMVSTACPCRPAVVEHLRHQH
jgi:apolipoprotein N-acyltransferase